VHFSVVPTKTAKQQALKAIAILRALIPIERAKLQLRLVLSDREVGETRAWLEGLDAEMITGESAIVGEGGHRPSHTLDLEVDPGLYIRQQSMIQTRIDVTNLYSTPGPLPAKIQKVT
jgi:ribosome maturation protein Sdo1